MTALQSDSWSGTRGSGNGTILLVQDSGLNFRSDIGTAMERLASRHGLTNDRAWAEIERMVAIRRQKQEASSSSDLRKSR